MLSYFSPKRKLIQLLDKELDSQGGKHEAMRSSKINKLEILDNNAKAITQSNFKGIKLLKLKGNKLYYIDNKQVD